MTVVVDNEAAVSQAIGLQTNSGGSKRTEADPFGENLGRDRAKGPTAFGYDPRAGAGIGGAIVAEFVSSTKDTIMRPRDGVEQGRIVTNDRIPILDFRNNDHLAAMRFQAGIGNKRLRSDPGTIDDKIELRTDFLQAIEVEGRFDLAAGGAEARGQIIKVTGGVGQRNIETESVSESVRDLGSRGRVWAPSGVAHAGISISPVRARHRSSIMETPFPETPVNARRTS